MDFKTNSGIWGTMFGVPCIIADNFLKLATGEQIKVLLYILRCSGKNCTDEEISANVGISIQQVNDSILFWRQVNVLADDSDSNARNNSIINVQQTIQPQPISETNFVEPSPQVNDDISKSKPLKIQPTNRKQTLTPSEISKLMKDSADISELFKTAEGCLGTLTHMQQNSLIWMYTYLGLKKEVIITLLAYCVSIEKTNVGYIEKIACDWSENEINSLNVAQEEISRMTGAREFTSQIMRSFEMKRRPTAKQLEFIAQWKSLGYSIELIHFAYEKTIEKIDKLSFEYINKILLTWREYGYTTVKNVRDAEENYKKKKKPSTNNNSNDDDFDVEKYKVFINNF